MAEDKPIRSAIDVAMDNAREFARGAIGIEEEEKKEDRRRIPLTSDDISLLKLGLQEIAGKTGNEYTRRRCVLLGKRLDGKEKESE